MWCCAALDNMGWNSSARCEILLKVIEIQESGHEKLATARQPSAPVQNCLYV